MKENIKMEREMEKEKNMMMKVIYYLKVNIKTEKKMVKAQNIIMVI
jgi:hypothetical protein